MIISDTEGIKIESRYTIDYIENDKDMESVLMDDIDAFKQSDRHKKKEFMDLGHAISTYMDMATRPEILHIVFLEEILLNGKSVSGWASEPSETDMGNIRKNVNQSMQDEIAKQKSRVDALVKKLGLYHNFVEKHHDMDTFEKSIA